MKINKGFSLVEAIIAVSIAVFSILTIWRAYTFFVKISVANPSFFQASFLVEEGIEAVKFMRDQSWAGNIGSLSAGADYFLIFDGTIWRATSTPIFIDNKFERRFQIFGVYRDGNGNIAESGSPDANTKKVSISVSWQKEAGATTTKQINTYVSNIFQN